jgi:hypothetical protein
MEVVDTALMASVVPLILMNLIKLEILIIIYLSGSNDATAQESISSEQNI